MLRKTLIWNETHKLAIIFFPLRFQHRTWKNSRATHPPRVPKKQSCALLHTLSLSSPPGTKLPIQRQSQAHRRHTERTHFIWWKIIKTHLFLNTKSHFPVLFFKSLWIMDGHYIQILTAWSAGEKITFSKTPIPWLAQKYKSLQKHIPACDICTFIILSVQLYHI